MEGRKLLRGLPLDRITTHRSGNLASKFVRI
jgi:hypothetical protein